MKYYTKFDFDNETTKQYFKYFNSIKDKLSKEYLNLYYKNDGFHDSIIENIVVERTKNCGINIKIILLIKQKLYALIYKNVSSYSFSVPKVNKWFYGTMSWGYGELELLQDEQWKQGMIDADFNCEYEIVCKKIYIKKV
ncbi:MAG: DUF4085 family protein [Oscillospiraceae bacterium]|nr:DUF4085 family protein [Oscillospiraceae bacterium]